MVWGTFCSQSDADSESQNRFRIGANLKIFGRGALTNLLLT